MTAAPTILVVEDNPTTRKMLRLVLVTEGYAVVEAADARAALAAAEKTLPDLILQDLILPDMDGLELLRRLRALPGGAELPILALSGFLSRLEEATTDSDGFTALLVKPIEPSRLIDATRVYLPREPAVRMSGGEGRRLLVVDDDLVQLKLTRIHFAQLGFDVSAASSASDALVAARGYRPDVILSDVFMPGTDGYDLCLEIRRDPALANVPVVLVSGQYGSRADQDLARRVGANALVLRTPDFGSAEPAILEALQSRAPMAAEQPSDQLALAHARLVIHQLERQVATTAGLVQRCGIQAGELSLLSGVAGALTRRVDPDVALREVLAATLDAAGISKGALILRDDRGVLTLRQDIGFSDAERSQLQTFFGHASVLDDIVNLGGSVSVPSSGIPDGTSRDILAGANVAAAHIVPLIVEGRSVGAMVIGATSRDVTSDDSVAFARAMGNQVVQSLALARVVDRLTESERRYRTLLENASDFIAVFSADGIVREVNQRWVEATGLSQDQLVGRQVRDLAPPGRRDEYAQIVEQATATSADRTPPVEIVRRDGSSAFVEFSTANVDVAGERLIFAVGRDVTQRLQSEAQLRLQGAALDAAANAMVITDRAGLIEWVNPAFSELTGYPAAEAIGRNPRDLLKSDRHDDAFYKNLWETIVRGQVWRGEMTNRRKDGSLYSEEQTITSVRDGHGEIRHFVAIKQNVTDRKRAEEELIRSAESLRVLEERMRSALQNANVGIFELDCATGTFRGSDIFESHLGVKPGTFGGTVDALVACIHPLDRDAMRQTIVDADAEFSAQYRILRPDGTIGWLNGVGRVHRGEHGEPLSGVGISLDVTERHALEEQFQQSQKMEAVGRLAGGVAHDFNNLLTAILGYCDLLLADMSQDDPRGADIMEIQKAGSRAAGLTRQLLAFSRKQIIEPALVDLNALVADLRGMLGRLIGEDVEIVVALRPDLAPVLADPGQVEQVIMNLAVNARDAMPMGGTLTIDTAHVELDEHYAATHPGVAPGPYVALRVRDTGTGMTAAVRARLFEPFFTTKELGRGTGLGLATVYDIVTRSGGTVGVDSEVGKGTAFSVYLPRAEAAQMVATTPAPVVRSHAGSQTVLVVDDEGTLRELAKRLLQRLGYTVLVAAHAAEARRLFDEHPGIDLLLTDVVMPGASGPELTRELIERRPTLKVIYMSGYTEDAIVQHGVLRPGIAFLNKPFTSLTLGQKIRDVLER